MMNKINHMKPLRIDLTMPCPFCHARGGKGTFGMTDPDQAENPDDRIAVTHSIPLCDEFINSDAMTFVREARKRLEKIADEEEEGT